MHGIPMDPLITSRWPRALFLARRFRKQIFLSVDVPPAFLSMGQGPKLLLEVEKGIVETLKEMEIA